MNEFGSCNGSCGSCGSCSSCVSAVCENCTGFEDINVYPLVVLSDDFYDEWEGQDEF